MLKELFDRIQETAQPLIQEIDGRTFCFNYDSYSEIQPGIECPDTLPLQSLDALVKLVKTEGILMAQTSAKVSGKPCPLYITVPDHLTVRCFGSPDPEKRYFRTVYYEAKATDVPGWDAKVTMGYEEAQIALRTRFQESYIGDNKYVQDLLSDIATGSQVVYNDNGVATSVTTKKGVALQSKENIKPIVRLKPYRTFQEVDQPLGEFLIRVSEHGITIVESDGGMWKLKARETIKMFLEEQLAAEIENGSVIIAL